MKIYVVRHGLTEMNKKNILNGHIDESLVEEGFEQARQVTSSIPRSVVHIYVSSLLRARQTAEILNKELKLPISFHDELKEVHLGHVTGKSWTEVEDGENLKEKHRSAQYDYRPEGESVHDVKDRIFSFLRKIKYTHHNEEVLIVTHGGIVRILQLLESGLSQIPVNQIKNASIYVFDLEKIFKNHS